MQTCHLHSHFWGHLLGHLYISPERLLQDLKSERPGPLHSALRSLCDSGDLNYFVVDEAHVVVLLVAAAGGMLIDPLEPVRPDNVRVLKCAPDIGLIVEPAGFLRRDVQQARMKVAPVGRSEMVLADNDRAIGEGRMAQ